MKNVLLKETPKIKCILIPCFDAKDHNEIEKRKNNIVIRGIKENETKNVYLLQRIIRNSLKITLLCEMLLYMSHIRLAKKQREGKSSRATVCTILDEHKRAIILDSSKVYLKGTSLFVTEDRTPQEQERRRQASYASRKANQNALQATTYRTINTSRLKVSF